MRTDESGAGSDCSKWRVAQRVSRRNSGVLGTITEVGEHAIKIKWDDGATSYYRRDNLSNVLLKEPPQQ
jgi:preprotein translocase subunit YajC